MKLNRVFNWKSLPFIAEKRKSALLNVSIRLFGAMSERQNQRLSRLKLIPTNLSHQTNEFFTNSTLHGVRYIYENGRAFGEKFIWFCCVAIGFVTALIIIDSLWEKFQTEPTITGMIS
jgi:Amiloride-sensitive sodium channel